jgi:hypothetical protein
VAIDAEIQARGFPRLERIVEVSQEAKEIVFALTAFSEPFFNG